MPSSKPPERGIPSGKYLVGVRLKPNLSPVPNDRLIWRIAST
jgi:hypothetical protein